ncbi:XrtA/PEP-CTERM system-associated ATPase [Emcibacter sp.]|uniref:XrtA/PEP-CTERM system-associated ATPase n=1 Tax=Emcibacter sp. TaxID=1979954 RepID=UPI003A9242BA
MYAEFYGLEGKPFQLTPDPRFYFDSSTHHKAMAYLTYGLSQGEGFIIITGEIGAGKTTLVGHLLNELDTDKFVAAKIVTTNLEADDILRMVAVGFGLDVTGKDKSILLRDIETFLRQNHRNGRRALLLIDEVQNLPTKALEELRMLSNFQEGDRALLQSFLVGQPEFRDKWAFDPDLEQLRQRVIATHHLQAMTYDETREYVEHRLTLVGWKNNPSFDDGAFRKIYEYTQGVPRRLNTLCSRILLYGAIEEVHAITEKIVADVIADMEQENALATRPVNSPSSIRGPINGGGGQMASAAEGASLPADLEERLDRLEKYVRVHDETIKAVLDIASVWIGKNAERGE